MDTKEYISSGILELYAAGQLSETESADVEANIRKYTELKIEYEQIQKALYISALNNLKSPSEKVKLALLKKVNPAESENFKIGSTYTEARSYNSYRYLMAASIAFLLFSLAANFYLWNKLESAENEIAVLSDQKKLIIQDYEAVSRKLSITSKDMEIMKDRNYKMVDLKGLEKSPGSNVLAFWNPESKKLYVGVMSLPVPPPGKQYQLWALSNGKPVNAGVMDVDPSDKSLHEMKSMDDAQAFAVTLEPKGGSVNPTMNEMYVMGSI